MIASDSRQAWRSGENLFSPHAPQCQPAGSIFRSSGLTGGRSRSWGRNLVSTRWSEHSTRRWGLCSRDSPSCWSEPARVSPSWSYPTSRFESDPGHQNHNRLHCAMPHLSAASDARQRPFNHYKGSGPRRCDSASENLRPTRTCAPPASIHSSCSSPFATENICPDR